LEVDGKVLILGCGNVLLGDDGFGPAVARRCSRFKLGGSILALDLGTSLSSFMMELVYGSARPKALIVVDVADEGRAAGEVFTVPLTGLESRRAGAFGLHDFPSVAVFKELERAKDTSIEIVACQPKLEIEAVGIRLSDEVKAAVPSATRLVVKMARAKLGEGRGL
jgi:coenzyme F420 hydrogenase subunit delta